MRASKVAAAVLIRSNETQMARTTPKRSESALLDYALSFPGATEEWPWDERVIKVNGKIFVFLGFVATTLRVGVKLPVSSEMALTLPFVEKMGYGLGKSGWVTARFEKGETPPINLLKGWIEQSYRAVAPKKLIHVLDQKKAAA